MTDIITTHGQLPSWNFAKSQGQTQQYDSPPSDTSSAIVFRTAEKLTLSPTMEDIRVALKDRAQSNINDEYQSSEEALSPMLEDDADEMDGFQEADDEEEKADAEDDLDTWEHVRSFEMDMAVAICVIAKGKPRVVNIPPRWAQFRKQYTRESSRDRTDAPTPIRTDSAKPNVPSRSTARFTVPNLDTRYSVTSMPSETNLTSRLDISPDDLYPSSINREASVFSLPPYSSATTLTPPHSEQGSESPTPSFLQSDPFESNVPPKKKPIHGRLRSISSKFKFASTEKREEVAERPTNQREKRGSLRVGGRPATPPSFFDHRSSTSDESIREEPVRKPAPLAPAPSFIAPLQNKGGDAVTNSARRSYPKLVARGANEREPAISLPPCPKTYDQDVPRIARSQTDAGGPRSPNPTRVNSMQYVRRRTSLLGMGM